MSVEPRCRILVEYAKWTALSAVRAGAPIRDRETVYRLLDGVAFSKVLDSSLGPIRCRGFNEWHTGQTEDLCERAKPDLPPKWVEAQGQQFPVGWGAKLINVFLKTAVYAGGLGREGLRDVLHPPLDNGLRKGLIEHFHDRSDMLEKVDFGKIEGCHDAAKELGCSLIEVEQLAGLGLVPGEERPGELVSAICRGVG